MLGELKKTWALALPIIAGQVGQMLMAWADTVMVGRLGVVPLAASAFANALIHLPLVGVMGLMSAVSVLAARAHGAGDGREAGRVLRAGLMLSLLAGATSAVLASLIAQFLDMFGQPEMVAVEARSYFVILAWSLVPAFIFVAFKSFSEALGSPWTPLWITIGAVLFNVFLNWIFIYGNWGAPALGLDGAAWATLAARVVSAVVMGVLVLRASKFRPHFPRRWITGVKFSELAAVWAVGLPIGLHILSEVGAFAVATVMCGWLGSVPLAAHQIALTCAATTFMVPLGLSTAVTVRLGAALGAGERRLLAPIGYGALVSGLVVMVLFAAMYGAFGTIIAGWFVEDRDVVVLGGKLLIVAALFQVFDGGQVIGAGALRGLGDVRVPMCVGVLAYWGIALPCAWALAFLLGFGAVGIWVGLAVGLALSAVALNGRFAWKVRDVR